MKIDELPEPYRKLANLRASQEKYQLIISNILCYAFKWEITPEGYIFWHSIYYGELPEIPNQSLKELQEMDSKSSTIREENCIEDVSAQSDLVNNPPHYKQGSIEVFDMMVKVWGAEKVKIFCEINAFKYRMRAGNKEDAVQDIAKAQWYENKMKEL